MSTLALPYPGANAISSPWKFYPATTAVRPRTTAATIDESIKKELPAVTITEASNSISIANLETQVWDAKTELKNYLNFSPGWDGYSGDPFDSESISKALMMVETAKEVFRINGVTPDEITPCPIGDGSIDIEIRVGNRQIIFTISPNSDKLSCFIKSGHLRKNEELRLEQASVEERLFWLLD